MSWAVSLANRRYSVEQIHRALAAKPSGRRDPGSIKYQRLLDTKGLDAAEAYAWRTARKALDFVRVNPKILDPAEGTLAVLAIGSLAGALPWGLYGGSGPRRALEAAFVIGERVGSVCFGLALRQWAEISGQTLESVRKNRDVLLSLGWLSKLASDTRHATDRFRLRRPSHIRSRGRFECGNPADRGWLAHDAFRPGALGDDGWYVMTLLATAASARELTIASGMDPDDLEALLAKLERLDLIDTDEGGILRRADDLPQRLDLAAATLGSAGSADRDRERHAAERAAYRSRLGAVGAVKRVGEGPGDGRGRDDASARATP